MAQQGAPSSSQGCKVLHQGGNPVHTGVNVVLSLPSMEFPFPFLNLNENGILPLFSRDCGANPNFIFKSF